MDTAKLKRRLFWGAEVVLLAGTVGAAAWLGRAEEWQPLGLVAFLLVLTLAGEWLTIKTHSGEMTASFVALILAMSLLGPVPAVVFGIAVEALTSARKHLRPAFWLGNLTTFAVVLFMGGWLVRALAGNVHSPGNLHTTQGIEFGLIVFGAFLVATTLNAVMVALDVHIAEGRSLRAEISELFLPVLPGQLAIGALATILAVAYTNLGLQILLGAVVILVIFRQLTVALLRSEERAEQLEGRSRQLVGLQLGVLRTLVRALGKRDTTAGRHAAAVGRYAKALAIELGCGEDEQDVIHIAGLLHDVGKFEWPDRVLHAAVVDEQDLTIVRGHPQEGAILVGALDGYGEVAEAILYHHERIDGGGYPAGLIGNEIPLASRIVAICSTYDTMTTGRHYQAPIPPAEARDELRNAAAAGQLDVELVERFIAVLEREGAAFAEDADFEIELDFERRVRQMAQPRSPERAARGAPAQSGSGGRDWRSSVRALGQRTLNK
ncbi:MAG TPA: HD domain-containing phosphohydrolase [Solirubrobacteraceae bacterium]|nr:HD domain-containing phosphohydrolase [Solirubrobacteraceae bacterium]